MTYSNHDTPNTSDCAKCAETAHSAHRSDMTRTIERPQRLTAVLDELLTMEELEEYTKTPMSTLYSLRSAGKGPVGFRIGRGLRFRRSDVDAWTNALVASALAKAALAPAGRSAR